MAKQKINIRIHLPENADALAVIQKRVTDFHYKTVEREVNSLDLTADQCKKLIDYIIADLRTREVNGVIY